MSARAAETASSILLVEDKDSLRAMLRLALEAQGHAVIEARDEVEAVISILRDNYVSSLTYVFPWAMASACCARPRRPTPNCR